MARYFDFKAPRPYEVIQWRQQPGDDPCPGLVTARFERTINCTIFPMYYSYGVNKDAVRHISDPERSSIDINEGGGFWDFTEDQKMLHDAVGDPVDKVKMMK